MNGLLIGVIVFLAAMAVIGAMKGLVKMVLSVAVVIVAGVLVWLSAPYVRKEITARTTLESKLADTVTEKLHGLIENDNDLESRIESLPLTEKAREVVMNTKNSYDEKLKELGTYIAGLIFNAAIYLALFLICYIVLRLIAFLLERLADSDGLRFINRASGSLLAIVEGLLLLDVLALALVFFAGTDFGMKAYEQIYENEILTWFYENNFLLMMVNRHIEGM